MLSIHIPKPPLHHRQHSLSTAISLSPLRNHPKTTAKSFRVSAYTPQKVYQPFRPPPSPLPSKFRSLDAAGRLEVLSDRLGLWFEYAPLIPALIAENNYTAASIEEVTGISAVEQNLLIVSAKVRETITDLETLAYFETRGAELLYEIRLLSTAAREDAARLIVEYKLGVDGARDIARAVKDFPKRKEDRDWGCFDYDLPGDCLAFMYLRQSREHKNSAESDQRFLQLQLALQFAETDTAKKAVSDELEPEVVGMEYHFEIPVIRIKPGEAEMATDVVVLPVCREEEKGRDVMDAPLEKRGRDTFACELKEETSKFDVLVSENGWKRWLVLPKWDSISKLGKEGVVIAFSNAEALPWKVNEGDNEEEEGVVVVADRGRKKVIEKDGFYLVTIDNGGRSDGLKVEQGSVLIEKDVHKSLGMVLLVVLPPKGDDQ